MRYAGIIKNDVAAGKGVNVTFFVQGCPFQCPGCHNPQTWDFGGGKEFTNDTLDEIVKSINANGWRTSLSGKSFLNYISYYHSQRAFSRY